MTGHSLTKKEGGIFGNHRNDEKPLLVTEEEAELLKNVVDDEKRQLNLEKFAAKHKDITAKASLIDAHFGIEKPKSQQKLHDIIDTIFRNIRQFEVVIHVTIITTVFSNVIIEPQLIKALPLVGILPIRGIAHWIKK